VFEIEAELWGELSAAAQERKIYLVAQEYHAWLRSLTLEQRWAERRRAELRVARAYRAALREVQIEPFHKGLKRSQTRLLKLRIERTTGIVPG
jgi:hypothetical protein